MILVEPSVPKLGLLWFKALSRLKINLEMEDLVRVLGWKVGALPTTYLGLQLKAPYKSSRVWEGVEARFQKRLAMWKT